MDLHVPSVLMPLLPQLQVQKIFFPQSSPKLVGQILYAVAPLLKIKIFFDKLSRWG